MGPASNDDLDLLRQYAQTGSDVAFAQLVSRHSDMVYACAVRQLGGHAGAEEVTQAVFILLMRKAGRISDGTVVAAWLYKATRYTVLNLRKLESRRQRHERRAGEMAMHRTHGISPWADVAPLLDEAINTLKPKDRSAVVLRFLERRSFAEVGAALGVNENAAQMRVQRALSKLRDFFGRRGVVFPIVLLSAVLWANAAEAAPPTLRNALNLERLRTLDELGTSHAVGRLAGLTARCISYDPLRIAAGWVFAAGVASAGVMLFLSSASSTSLPSAPPPPAAPHQGTMIQVDASTTHASR